MPRWQLQEAKQRFSRLVDLAEEEGPQVVTRHGAEVAVVLAATAYRDLVSQARPSFKDVLLRGSGVEDDDGGALLDALPPRGRWRAKPPEAAPSEE